MDKIIHLWGENMPKIHKVTLYLTDFEEMDKRNIEVVLERMADREDMSLHIAKQNESEVFEWDDNLFINKRDANADDFEAYMKKG